VITENGYPLNEASAEEARYDLDRICYIQQYLVQLSRAMKDGINVRGYFVWTLLDNFEWAQGTAPRFGLLYVDFLTQRRTAKGSAAFYAKLAESHSFEYDPATCNVTSSVQGTFKSESNQLAQIINRTSDLRQQTGQGTPVAVRRAIVARATRLAALADVEARHTAEGGYFRATRLWVTKAKKMRVFVERQRELLERVLSQQSAEATAVPPSVGDEAAKLRDQQQPQAGAPDVPVGQPPDDARLRDLTKDLEDAATQIENEIALEAQLESEGNNAASSEVPARSTEQMQTAVVDAAPVDKEDE